MLIEMSVTNFRSFRETQTLSLMKGTGNELVSENTFEAEGDANKFQLLRAAVVYGANASGKSNFLAALEAMRGVVVGSATNQRGDLLPVMPFRLSPETCEAPCEFEAVFILDGVRYQYGFSATSERIHEEWLFAYPKGRAQQWFSREWSEKSKQYEWELGRGLVGEKQLWQKSTRDNALFLSTAVQLNSEQLQPVFDWFTNKLKVALSSNWAPAFSASIVEKGEGEKIVDFIRSADIVIDDIRAETKSLEDALPDDMPKAARKEILDEMKGAKVYEVKTVHKDSGGKGVEFAFDEESDGTQKLFSMAGPWFDVLENGRILCVDEMHAHLHPELVKFLIQLFHSNETNPKNAQLIFTTHETSIMSQKIFRRDQIWFCERDKNQATSLYPLTDFSPRKGREKLGAAYLSGRYGAVPFVRDIQGVAGG